MRIDQEDGPTSSAGQISATNDRQALTAVRAFEERFSRRARYLSAKQVVCGATAANMGMALGAQLTPPCNAQNKYGKLSSSCCQISITCGSSTSINTCARLYFTQISQVDQNRGDATDGWMIWRFAQAWSNEIPPINLTGVEVD